MFGKIKMFFAARKLIKVANGGKQMKKGLGTSEFWVVVIFAVLGVVNNLFGLGISDDTLENIALVVAGYLGSRTVVKAVAK